MASKSPRPITYKTPNEGTIVTCGKFKAWDSSALKYAHLSDKELEILFAQAEPITPGKLYRITAADTPVSD